MRVVIAGGLFYRRLGRDPPARGEFEAGPMKPVDPHRRLSSFTSPALAFAREPDLKALPHRFYRLNLCASAIAASAPFVARNFLTCARWAAVSNRIAPMYCP